MSKQRASQSDSGFALVATIFFILVLVTLLAAYTSMSRSEIGTTQGTSSSLNGFASAEGGLNLRAESIRQVFIGYDQPNGTSPSVLGVSGYTGARECTGSNVGAGDFGCVSYTIGKKSVLTYVAEAAGNPLTITIPAGERYQNLVAQEYRYTANSLAQDNRGETNAALKLNFKSRLVPMFQFASFFDKDLEILPGPAMTLSGPVHSNGDIYLNAGSTLTVTGQLTVSGKLYRGRKNSINYCSGIVTVSGATMPGCSGGNRREITQADLDALVPLPSPRLQLAVPVLAVPTQQELDPIGTSVYFDRADLRLALHLVTVSGDDVADTSYAPTGIEVRTRTNSIDTAKTTALAACTGSLSGNKAVRYERYFKNYREGKYMDLLDIDTRALFNCIHAQNLMGAGKTLSDTSDAGLVFHVTVDGPNSNAASNRYGIRLRNSGTLRSTTGAPNPIALSVVSNQAVYLMGDYNVTNWVPAAVLADTINLLSPSWKDEDEARCGSKCTQTGSCCISATNDSSSNRGLTASGCTASSNANCRLVAMKAGDVGTFNTATMRVQAAFFAGTDTSCGPAGTAQESLGGWTGTNSNACYNGGLENYPRLLEEWGGETIGYRGSFASLGNPRHVNSTWGGTGGYYNPPTRAWDYDTRFNTAANLPPISPRFIYLRQEFFGRNYELE